MLLFESHMAVIVNGDLCDGHVCKFLTNGLVDDVINRRFIVVPKVFVGYEPIGGVAGCG